jgi:hypothetical protein
MPEEPTPKELGVPQRATLLILMVKNAPVPLADLNKIGISLKLNQRKDLEARKLIEVNDKPWRPNSKRTVLVLTLTEDGWGEVKKEFTKQPPPGSGSFGGSLYLLLNFLQEFFDRSSLSAPEFFAAAQPAVEDEAAPPAAATDLADSIRAAYAKLAPRSGDYVMLDEIREAIPGAAKAGVDSALRDLDRAADVHLIPESNQKLLTASQRAAAVSIGNQDMHLITIGS